MKIIFNAKGKSSEVTTIEDSDTLTKGNYIFSNTEIGSFNFFPRSLEYGEGMFGNTTLSSETLNEIANTIKVVDKDNTHTIDLGYVYDDSIVKTIEGKGWIVSYIGGGGGGTGKYANCKTLDDVKAEEADYKTTDIINGAWYESLAKLGNGNPTGQWNSGMFYNCTALSKFIGDLSSLTEGQSMFYGSGLVTFYSDLSSLTDGDSMFYSCGSLKTFYSDLSSLTDGQRMFQDCYALATFTSDLSSLTVGDYMFSCTNLTTFTNDLSSLASGSYMFYECNFLETFYSDLSSLTDGRLMFYGCGRLETFYSDLSSLTDGGSMFRGCECLETFYSDLSSLTNGSSMFRGCNLTAESITRIAKSLSFVNKSTIHIGNLGRSIFSTVQAACELMSFKGWSVDYVMDETDQTYIPIDDYSEIKQVLTKLNQDYNIKYTCEELGVIKIYIDLELKDDNDVKAQLQSIRDNSWSIKEYVISPNIIKYKNCTTVNEVQAKAEGEDSNYQTDDIVDGIWSEPLPNLQDGTGMFDSTSSPTTFNLKSFNSDLSSLTDGHRMFYHCNIASFNGDLSSLTDGEKMFQGSNLKSFSSDLSSLTKGDYMFTGCTALTSFTSDLSSLFVGRYMFSYCKNLASFSSDLSRLTHGTGMFYGCTALTSFTSGLSGMFDGNNMFEKCNSLTSFSSSLTNVSHGQYMFNGCTSLTSFTSRLSSLRYGQYMFNGCENLTTFTPKLSNLTDLINGRYMFNGCTSLTSFPYKLSNLTKGDYMFNCCKLNSESIQYIADNINNLRDKDITDGDGVIHIGYSVDDVTFSILYECDKKLTEKGWDAYFNGIKIDPYDITEANGWCPDAYKNGDDSWNEVVLKPIMDVLKISIVNEKGEMLNDE